MSRLELNPERLPIVVGAGAYKDAASIATMAEEEMIAAQFVGSFSYNSCSGKSDGGRLAVEHWDAETGAYFNYVALENPGSKAAGLYLPEPIKKAQDTGQKVILSVVALLGEDPKIVLPHMVEWALETGADGVEIDGSCRNLDPKHPIMCEDIAETALVFDAIRERVGFDPTIGYKVASLPLDIIEQHAQYPLWDYISTMNALGHQRAPINPLTGRPYIAVNNGYASMSGPVIKNESRRNARDWVRSVRNTHVDVVNLGGITDGEEIYERVADIGVLCAGGVQAFRKARDPRLVSQQWGIEYVMADPEFN